MAFIVGEYSGLGGRKPMAVCIDVEQIELMLHIGIFFETSSQFYAGARHSVLQEVHKENVQKKIEN